MNSETSAIANNRGRWSEAGVPHRGWTCIDTDDLGEPSHVCDMCQTTHVRHVHIMTHPAYPHALGVGCICAGHMAEDLVGAQRRESHLKSRAGKRSRWLTRRWRVSANGNEWLRADGFRVVILRNGPAWGYFIAHETSQYKHGHRGAYATSDAAKLGAFGAISWLLAHPERWRRAA